MTTTSETQNNNTENEDQTRPDPIADLLTTYEELNSNLIDEFFEEPSPLEFMRYVASNRPFVVRNGAREWKAVRCWGKEYLRERMEGRDVCVAVTPFGNADSPLVGEDGSLIFVKPLEETQSFSTFIDYITTPQPPNSSIFYSQTQNDNLRTGEFSHLYPDIPPSIPWARIALQKNPDAINLWIGTEKSVTALHKDNYENVFVQVRGEKRFVLLPPVAVAMVGERELEGATYVREGGELVVRMDREGDGGGGLGGEGSRVPFATWDPDDGMMGDGKYMGLLRPMRVTLKAGDMLYLPAMWYHKVSQSCGDEGFSCSVNYWYDMEFSGSLYPLCSFVRDIALSTAKPKTLE